eukprot:CAMPEP_0206325056 /NCGR_PEP_ID=MMETSP0106_2-20121207/20859_1 /ASSEMBLY_ACC=CAM_ASM_000206 /TAXON_ID=81532 /ORGANISM="Acanthoeca-like sp., Strain 10tr" /LENGTH=46 /DNA_ID= /DNA_START= /DNA_END= /DNA_ORIENTATION=
MAKGLVLLSVRGRPSSNDANAVRPPSSAAVAAPSPPPMANGLCDSA